MENRGVACLFGSHCLAVYDTMGIPSDAQDYYMTDFFHTGFCIETEGENKAPQLICAFLRCSKILPEWMELPFPATPPVSGSC